MITPTYTLVKKLLLLNPCLIVSSLFFLPQQAFAEGTKQISSDSTKITALTIIPSRGSGNYLNADIKNRIKFYIVSGDEWIYAGFNWKKYASSGLVESVDMYYRLYNANGLEVARGLLPSSGAGHINHFKEAVNGANGVSYGTGSVSDGYAPIAIQVSALPGFGAGEYAIDFYRSSDNGNTMLANTVWSVAPYFDITIAKKVANVMTAIPGRVSCSKWGFVAVNSSFQVTPDANAAPSVYAYTDDQSIIKIEFTEGFRPTAYDLGVNYWGTAKTGQNGSFDMDRRSVNAANSPVLPDGYRLFLVLPDATPYPVRLLTAQPSLANPAITGDSTSLVIHFNLPAPGDVRIVIDLNNVDDYQEGSKDRLIEAFNLQAGANTVTWDGKDGSGTAVAAGDLIKISIIYERGRFNIPLYDAEINKNGFNVSTIAPIALANTRLYWDDSKLTNIAGQFDIQQNNNTNAGIDNSQTGTLSPAHAWSGTGNYKQTLPAPDSAANSSDLLQFNDFGNVRVINTWGWALQSATPLRTLYFGSHTVEGHVFNDGNGLNDGKVATSGNNIIAIPSGLYANLIATDTYTDNNKNITVTNTVIGVAEVINGTYTISNVQDGTYTILLSTTQGITGSATVPSASLTGLGAYVNTGENGGNPAIAGHDGRADGLLSVTVSGANVTNANFGIERLPTAQGGSMTVRSNPGGTSNTIVTSSLFSGKDPEDAPADKTLHNVNGDKIQFTAFPTNATSVTLANTTYNATSWASLTMAQRTFAVGTSVAVDPADNKVTVAIPYKVVDAAGQASTVADTVYVPFSDTIPDITPIIRLPFNNFAAANVVRNFTVELQELQGIATAKTAVEFAITVPVGYSLSFNPSQSSINVSGIGNVDIENAAWNNYQVSLSGRRLTFKAKTGISIAALQKSVLGFTITRTTSSPGTSPVITVNVFDNTTSTYDGNSTNNIFTRIINSL